MKPKNKIIENIKAVLIALLAALILRQFVIASYNVPTGSMKDTILIGDFMFVNKFIYGARTPTWIGIPFTDKGFYVPFVRFPAITKPKQYDIVVFEYPRERRLDYIKRCVAVGGQSVEVKDNKLYINGNPEGEETFLYRKFDPEENRQIQYYKITTPTGKTYTIRHALYNGYGLNNYNTVIVPPDHYFMMGDNRDNSQDSRVWGFVPPENIVGKPLIIWLSWNGTVPGYRLFKKIRWGRLGSVVR